MLTLKSDFNYLDNSQEQMRTRLCAFVIVDHLDLLQDCLASIRHFFDDVYVVAGASASTSDKLRAVCYKFGAHLLVSKLRDDRSAMLNAALSTAEFGWGLYLRSSERLPTDLSKKLRTIISAVDGEETLGYMFKVNCHGQQSCDEIRLFRSHESVRFKGHCFPQPITSRDAAIRNLVSSGCSIEKHANGNFLKLGYLRIEHEILLLHLDLCETPNSIFIRSQLAECYRDLGISELVDRYRRKIQLMKSPTELGIGVQNQPQVFLMRGLPNSGKSTRAIQMAGETGIVCETDAFLRKLLALNNGETSQTSALLMAAARRWSRESFIDHIDNGSSLIIVDRGNGRDSETYFYARYAEQNGYQVHLSYPQSQCWLEIEELLDDKSCNRERLIAHAQRLSTLSKSSQVDSSPLILEMIDRWIVDLSVEDILAWKQDQLCE